MIYIYIIPIICIILLYIFTYTPYSARAKTEHYNMRSYINSAISTLAFSLIPIFNIIVLIVLIFNILEYHGYTVGFEEWLEDIKEKIDRWLDKEL